MKDTKNPRISKNILITGGAGYIGSHTLIELSIAGYNFVVYDNLCNSSQESLMDIRINYES